MEVKFTDYKRVQEASEEWGVNRRRVLHFCEEGRIPGAFKSGGIWLIPRDAAKPSDGRLNNRRHPQNDNK